jgi:hypothetical protein
MSGVVLTARHSLASHPAAKPQNSRAAKPQNSRAAKPQNSRAARPQNDGEADKNF